MFLKWVVDFNRWFCFLLTCFGSIRLNVTGDYWSNPLLDKEQTLLLCLQIPMLMSQRNPVDVDCPPNGSFFRWWVVLIFHILLEQRRCDCQIRLAMRPTFIESCYDMFDLLLFFVFVLNIAGDDITHQITIFRDWMALKPCCDFAILRRSYQNNVFLCNLVFVIAGSYFLCFGFSCVFGLIFKGSFFFTYILWFWKFSPTFLSWSNWKC